MRLIQICFFFLLLINCSFSQKIKVLGTASMFSDMASEIGGKYVETDMIVPLGGDPHSYNPTPNDVKKVRDADIVLRNGLTFEGWLSSVIENAGTEGDIVRVTEGISPIESMVYQGATDPHAWMSPLNGKIYARNIADAIIKKLPERKNEVEANLLKYNRELEKIHQKAITKIGQIPEKKRILITSHDAFQYFGRQYGIQLESVLGISTDADVRTEDIVRLEEVIRESGVRAVFIESTINPKVIRQIAKDNGIVIGGELYADSLGDKESSGSTYLKMLRSNINTFYNGIMDSESTSGSNLKEPSNAYDNLVYVFLGLTMLGVFFYSFFKLNGNF